MNHQQIIFSNDIQEALDTIMQGIDHSKAFILTDINVKQFVFPKIAELPAVKALQCITIKSGDLNKNIESAATVWKQLDEYGATRRSVMINIGGGVVTDLGGFAASVFKRGIRFINVPTTLLGAVDAAIGGKTGINFNGLKNEIGVFNEADAVIISTLFFDTLPMSELKSGYAEMLKHGLLSDRQYFSDLINHDIAGNDLEKLLELLKRSVIIKRDIVAADPHEQGLRRALNLGHTVGHAFESMAMKRSEPVPHGYAVAWGIVCELYYSCLKTNFPKDKMRQTVRFIKDIYGTFNFDCSHYEQLYGYMTHDKKNEGDKINFTLLSNVGEIKINQSANKQEIFDMLDFYRESMN